MTEEFTLEDLKSLIISTLAGRELLRASTEKGARAPEIVPLNALPEELRGDADPHAIAFGKAIARFIPKGLAGNERSLVAYSHPSPLFAAAYMTSHELQHALDQESAWWILIQAKLEEIHKTVAAATASGGLTLEDLESQELAYGLKDVRKYLTEVSAFSRGAAVRRELESVYPPLAHQWVRFKEQHGIQLDCDPATKPGDRQKIYDAYIWGGNSERFDLGMDYIRQDAAMRKAVEEAGLPLR